MQYPTPSSDVWQSIIYCKRASWGFDYTVTSQGIVIAQVSTPETITLSTSSDSVESSKSILLRTTDVIKSLWEGSSIGNANWLQGYTGGIQQWAIDNSINADRFSNVIWLNDPVVNRSVEVLDSNDGNDLITFGQKINKYSDLPAICYDGYKVKVTGVDTTLYNDYYVTFNADNPPGIGTGIWEESAGFGVTTDFKASTMPHILTREADDSFLLHEVSWVQRKAGDDNTNPVPSFIGVGISDITSYQGRLVLISDENVIASVTFDHYNFFSDTVTVESDDDPIDTASSDNQVTNLHHALVFNSSLVLFSDRAEFIHPPDVSFTTKTFGLSSKARYKNIVECAPVASASSIFFAFQSGQYTNIRELQIENVTGNLTAEHISAQVDHYIPGSAKQLISSTDYNILIVRTDGDPTALYIFQWFNQGNKRQQAAWHRWEFSNKINHIAILQDKLYIWEKLNSMVSVEYIDLADTNAISTNFPVRLDHQQTILATDEGDNWKVDVTSWVNSGDFTKDDLKVIAGKNTNVAGAITAYCDDPLDSEAFLIPKSSLNTTNTPYFVVGSPIIAQGQITNPYVRSSDTKPLTKGKLRLSTMRFNCSKTGALDIIVDKESSSIYTKEFNGNIIDSGTFVLDTPPELINAEIKVPIRSDANKCNIKFYSDSHLPFYISNIDWSGSYYATGRRTT